VLRKADRFFVATEVARFLSHSYISHTPSRTFLSFIHG
jgi:hypothetical protein